jgi:hypothetical protein
MCEGPQVVGTAVAIPYGTRPPTRLEAHVAKKIPAALKGYQFKKGSVKAKAMGKRKPKKGKK